MSYVVTSAATWRVSESGTSNTAMTFHGFLILAFEVESTSRSGTNILKTTAAEIGMNANEYMMGHVVVP